MSSCIGRGEHDYLFSRAKPWKYVPRHGGSVNSAVYHSHSTSSDFLIRRGNGERNEKFGVTRAPLISSEIQMNWNFSLCSHALWIENQFGLGVLVSSRLVCQPACQPSTFCLRRLHSERWERVKYNMKLEMKKKIKWIWIIGRNVYWIFLLYRLLHSRKIWAFMAGNFLFTTQRSSTEEIANFSAIRQRLGSNIEIIECG